MPPDARTQHAGPNAAAAIVAIKVVHSLVWFSIESCVAYLLFTGFAGRTGLSVRVAAGVVIAESVVFAGNGFACPLTQLARSLGDDGSVTDIYLPRWVAANLPAIHLPLLALAAVLTGRNAHRRRDNRVGAA